MTYCVQSKTFFQFVPDVVHIWHKIHTLITFNVFFEGVPSGNMMAQKCFKTNSFGIISFTQCVVCSKVVSSIVRSWSIVCNDGLFYASNFQSMIFSVFSLKSRAIPEACNVGAVWYLKRRCSEEIELKPKLVVIFSLESDVPGNWSAQFFFLSHCEPGLQALHIENKVRYAWKKLGDWPRVLSFFSAWTSLQMGLLGVMQNKPSCQVSLRSFGSQAEAQL